MADVTEIALRLLRLYGPLALAVFTFLETSMLFPFLPSEVVVPGAAALLINDITSLFVFTLVAAAGGTVGAFVPFYVFRGSQLAGADWIRDRINVSEERIAWGQGWFRKWGRSSVFWGRFLPVLRSVVSIPAGLANMNSIGFAGFTAGGTVGFYAATGGVVYYGRQQSLFATAFTVAANNPVLAAIGIFVLFGIGLLVRYWSSGGILRLRP